MEQKKVKLRAKSKIVTNKCVYEINGHNVFVSRKNSVFIANCKKNRAKIFNYLFEKEILLIIDNSLFIFNYETKNNDYYLTNIIEEYILNNLYHREVMELFNEIVDINTLTPNYDIKSAINKIKRIYDILNSKLRRMKCTINKLTNE